MIREATLKDVKSIINFLKPFHEESGYKDIKIQDQSASQNLQIMLSSPMHKIWIIENDGVVSNA